MKSPLIKTLVMAVAAAVASGVAAFYYPWPEPVVASAIVGKPLFEPYDSTSVRSIRIVRFSAERNGLDQILLRRSGEKWIVPAHKNFIANNTSQIAAAANSLIDRIVLDETTDEQQAYLDFGVVDPDDYESTPNRSALGTKIVLEDRNRRELASLIVGRSLKNDPTGLKHYVRVPGQPNVYVIEFEQRALRTEFKSWVDPNLLQLSNQWPINKIVIENYRIDPTFQDAADPQRIYRAELNVVRQQLNLLSVKVAGDNGDWEKIGLTPAIRNQFQVIGSQIGAIQFSDVQRKNRELAKVFKAPKDGVNDSVFDSLRPFGVFKTGFKNSTFEFDSVGGEVSVETVDGVVASLHIGSIAENSDADNLQLSRYVIVCAGVDESMLEEPSPYVQSLSPDRFTDASWDWDTARTQARQVSETYYCIDH